MTSTNTRYAPKTGTFAAVNTGLDSLATFAQFAGDNGMDLTCTPNGTFIFRGADFCGIERCSNRSSATKGSLFIAENETPQMDAFGETIHGKFDSTTIDALVMNSDITREDIIAWLDQHDYVADVYTEVGWFEVSSDHGARSGVPNGKFALVYAGPDRLPEVVETYILDRYFRKVA